jgi:hypothetical protein
MLNSWVELRELNNELIRKAIENRGSDRSTLEIAEKIRAQLAFRGGVSVIGNKNGGNGALPKRRWADAELWPDPTTLEGPGTIHAVAGKIRFLPYQVNAVNDFFASGRGKLELTCDHPRIGPAELVAGGDLRAGMVRASLLVPDDVAIGTTATITAAIRGWGKAAGGIGEDLEWLSALEVVDGAKRPPKPKPKGHKKTMAPKGSQVAVLWRSNSETDSWNGGVPGEIELIEASVLAAGREEYRDLAELGSEQIPTVVLNEDFTPLKNYEVERVKKLGSSGGDASRDRYAVGVGVGLLVLEDRNRKLEKEGKTRPDDTLVERQAVARAALALMPDFDKLIKEAQLESE